MTTLKTIKVISPVCDVKNSNRAFHQQVANNSKAFKNCITFITKRLKLFLKSMFNLPFLAICSSQFSYLWYKKRKLHWEWAWKINKMINYYLKGLYETTCYKTKFNYSQFFFSHWLLYEYFFSFLINTLVNFQKLIRFHQKKRRKSENTDRNNLPKTYSFWRYFDPFRTSET